MPFNAEFQLATTSSRNWIVRAALRKGVAWVQGINDPEPSIIELPMFEDSADDATDNDPVCNGDLPPDAIPSTTLTEQQVAELFG